VDVVLPAIVLALVVAAVALRPLLAGPPAAPPTDLRLDLEAEKESKYREIKDAELDFRMGKLSEAEWRSLDAELRGQAISILRRLDRLDPPEPH
jgi:hypothetical protein